MWFEHPQSLEEKEVIGLLFSLLQLSKSSKTLCQLANQLDQLPSSRRQYKWTQVLLVHLYQRLQTESSLNNANAIEKTLFVLQKAFSRCDIGTLQESEQQFTAFIQT
jgi:hypothetical protein